MKSFPIILATASIALAGCSRGSDSASEHDQLLIPLAVYKLSQFTNCQSFQAQIVQRDSGEYLNKSTGQTNVYFTLILQKTNGEEFAVSENSTSRRVYDTVSSLEKDRRYTFPDVLMMWSNTSEPTPTAP